MSCGTGGKKKSTYTGNQVGWLNFVGWFNFVAGGPTGSGISAGETVTQFIPNGTNRRPWLRQDATFDDKLLDACWPTIGLNWFIEIELTPEVTFRVSNQAFYVQDEEGLSRFIDARVQQPPTISVTVGDWLAPNYEVSDASFSLNNRDGHYNNYLPLGADYRQWSGAKVTVYVGFGEKRSNYFALFEGQVTTKQGLSTTRDTVDIKAYDKLDLDEIPMPPRVYSADNFPDIDSTSAGKVIPIVYGDWTVGVADAGSVSATCINAADDTADSFLFKVSDISLQSLDAVYLQRGNRKEGEPGGAVSLTLSAIEIDLENGQFTIPKGVDVLDSEISYADNSTAGSGSNVNLIGAKDSSVNFQTMRIQVGDRVIKRKTGEISIVATVLAAQLILTGGVAYAVDDEYVVLTRKYAFINGDKITVKCRGKALGLQSTQRVPDISAAIKRPEGLSIDKDLTFWMADDETQIIYQVDFDKTIIKQIPYASIDAALTTVQGISIGSASQLWVVPKDSSKIYRYDHAAGTTGLTLDTVSITGIMTAVSHGGIAVESDNKIWIVDNNTGAFYQIDPFSGIAPFVTTTFNRSAFDSLATDINDIAVDEENDQLIVISRGTNKYYRIGRAAGSLSSFALLTVLADNVSIVTGVSLGQDGSLFFVDQGTLSIYNYNEQGDASTNPAFIARDLLESFGNHNAGDFDLTWNNTARQLAGYKCRAVLDKNTNLITFINTLLNQYNVVFHLRFGKFSLFWITFENFVTTGKGVGEKDIKEGTFKPNKEVNQYFNAVSANYGYRPFTAASSTSDTYVSTAAVAFAGKQVNRVIDMPAVYAREDLDRLLPLLVKLSAPEPEFVDVTFGFRILRSQMQDFMTLTFDGDVNCKTGRKESGRRYNHVPCMVRKITYDLGPMTVAMKLWSLGSTSFPGYTPEGPTVGGFDDVVVLSSTGRLGRISPTGTITAGSTNSVTLEDVGGLDAEHRQNSLAGPSWVSGYKVDIIDGATKAVLQTLTIDTVIGQVLTFVEDLAVTSVNTSKNAAGFVVGGQYLQYSTYENLTEKQRASYASIARPTVNYPTSKTQELEEQRSGAHNFDDGGLPYVLYPAGFVSY